MPALDKLLTFLTKRLDKGALVLYGGPGTFRTRLALFLCEQLAPSFYIGAGRHARLKVILRGVEVRAVTSFYDELLTTIECVGFCKQEKVKLVAIDEFMANLAPYRASLSESYVYRMALTEVSVLGLAVEAECKVLLVCAEDYRTGGPLTIKILRRLKPRLVRTVVVNGVLTLEERDLADPLIALGRFEVDVEEVEKACGALSQN
ncbi:MAG: hypothetical protein QXV98_00145 [Thermofilaceae archaeon]